VITVLTGENSFEIDRETKRRIAAFSGETERFDGIDISKEKLADIFIGTSLFASKRLVIIRHLSENKAMWSDLELWINKLSDDTELLFIEPKPDKRTKTYKLLQKQASVTEYKSLGERDFSQAEMWLKSEAKKMNIELELAAAKELVVRLGVEQWTLINELEKLAAFEVITKQIVEQHTPKSAHDSVFELLTTALSGKSELVHEMLANVRISNDPYMTFGLLSSQIFQLAALVLSDKPSDEVAKDIGAHPFALKKMSGYRHKLDQQKIARIIELAADSDMESKTSSADPWVLIETLLIKISNL
jgi:DNA polymerase III subunit delta